MSVEDEGDGVVGYQHWSPHLPPDYLSVHGDPVLDPSVEIPVSRLYDLCHRRHLVHYLVRDQRPWKGSIQ